MNSLITIDKLIILSILVMIYLYYSSKNTKEKMSNQKKDKKTDLQKKIYYGLEIIDKIFNKHNIYYSIAYGTLLGAVRHWDLIEWDDDADLHILKSDIPKIMKLKKEFEKYGLVLEKDWKLVKIYFSDTKYPFIDLFPVENNNGKTKRCLVNYKNCVEIKQSWWTYYYNFPYKWLLDRKRLKFGKLELWAPKESIKLLKFWYGKDCLKKCMTHNYDHVTGKYVKPKIVLCKNLPKPQII